LRHIRPLRSTRRCMLHATGDHHASGRNAAPPPELLIHLRSRVSSCSRTRDDVGPLGLTRGRPNFRSSPAGRRPCTTRTAVAPQSEAQHRDRADRVRYNRCYALGTGRAPRPGSFAPHRRRATVAPEFRVRLRMRSTIMRAKVFRAVNQFGSEEVPRPDAGEALIRVTLTPIRGTELAVVRGES